MISQRITSQSHMQEYDLIQTPGVNGGTQVTDGHVSKPLPPGDWRMFLSTSKKAHYIIDRAVPNCEPMWVDDLLVDSSDDEARVGLP